MARLLPRLLAALVVMVAACGPQHPKGEPQARLPTESLTIETAKGPLAFTVEIADSEPERQAGLMFRPALPARQGMLFVFEGPGQRAFWMKNTPEPLDILYISPGGRIETIARRTKPWSEEPIPSRGASLGVLEIAGGQADALGVAEGDRVRHRIFP